MAVVPGTRFGVYEIQSAIGAGGMGEVYRATDTKLGRAVALKLLPSSFVHDPERIARFQREAQLLAALNHPHIAAIYGIEEANGAQFLVLELVEGETLAQKLAAVGRALSGPPAMPDPIGAGLPVPEALSIAMQIADALQAAHEKGIIHRDLKPGNIALTLDGQVKVLDFGLAKMADATVGAALQTGPDAMTHSPTLTFAATQASVILGTAAYMAPEQARGKAVDKRADIWAFGCVLYEMLTGRRAFEGDTVSDTLAGILRGEPEWTALPTDLPPALATYLRRCLQKDPRQRVQDIGDVRLALEGAFDVPAPTSLEASAAAVAARSVARRSRTAVVSVAAGVALLSGAAIWALTPGRGEPPAPVRRFAIETTAAAPLSLANANRDVTITPDGTRLVYFGGQGTDRKLYVRPLNELEAKPIREAPRFFEPFVSPDGRWIAFNDESDYTLRKVPAAGGPPVPICPVRTEIRGATWGPDDTIVYAMTQGGLWRVPASGGQPEALTTLNTQRGDVAHLWPEFLPGGKALLFTIASRGSNAFQVAALNLSTGEQKILLPGGSSPHFLAGYLVYGIEGTLRAVPFDPNRLAVTGDPSPVLEGLLTKASGGADFAVSPDGTLVYVSGSTAGIQRQLVWVDRNGREDPVNAPLRAYNQLRLSPDGTRAALDIRDQESDVWIWDFARQTLTRLTFDQAIESNPVWTADGRRIAYSSSRVSPNNVFWQAADGTGPVERLTESTSGQYPNTFSPDGSRLVFREEAPDSGRGQDLSMLSLDDPRRVVPLVQTKFSEQNADISPDGRWLAYHSNESGQDEVYVRPFPEVEKGRWQISTGGGIQPVWAVNGRELFYRAPNGSLMAVATQSDPVFSAGSPRVVIQKQYVTQLGRSYDVSRDGSRFLVIKTAENATVPAPGMIVVLNWVAELKRLVATKR